MVWCSPPVATDRRVQERRCGAVESEGCALNAAQVLPELEAERRGRDARHFVAIAALFQETDDPLLLASAV
jgi:hypothetical protein